MWRALSSLLADALLKSGAPPSAAADCTIPHHRGSGLLSRVIPAPDAGGIAVVWQDADSIFLKRFDRSCREADGVQVEVNRTRSFWVRPLESGLGDAAGLAGGATAVAWTLGGDVWVRIVRARGDSRGSMGHAFRANGPGEHHRADVRIVAGSDAAGGFVVAWSSWSQDGDGWGVFARPFAAGGEPSGDERQLNVAWEYFQWRPQLAWCGGALWALWVNGTGSSCGGDGKSGLDCTTGPFLRHIGDNGNMSRMGPEINFTAHGPVSAALSCDGTGGNAAILWLENGGKEVRWDYRSPAGPPADAAARRDGDERRAAPPVERRRLMGLPLSTSTTPSVIRASPPSSSLRQGVVRSSAIIASYGQDGVDRNKSLGAYPSTDVTMLANNGLMVLLTNDHRGTLEAQLLDYSDHRGGIAFPEHHVAGYVQFYRAAWDVTNDQALIMCWTTGSPFRRGYQNSFSCVRRRSRWLMGAEGLSIGDEFFIVVSFSAVSIMCLASHCTRSGQVARRMPLRSAAEVRQRRASRAQQQARLRELREQLADIPLVGSAAGSDGASHGKPPVASSSEASLGGAGTCSICRHEATMWVAIRPCGHTGCQQCIQQHAGTSQTCHACHGPIEGLLPVYNI